MEPQEVSIAKAVNSQPARGREGKKQGKSRPFLIDTIAHQTPTLLLCLLAPPATKAPNHRQRPPPAAGAGDSSEDEIKTTTYPAKFGRKSILNHNIDINLDLPVT